MAREDLGLEGAFWAQFPGNFAKRTRPAAITSRNFAALAPFHAHPVGRAAGNHWGEAVALLRTTAGSPYWFNFHLGDLGHTFICGPSGSGKTVVQNFMLAQLERFGAQQLFIDKDRGAEIFVRACGGTYLTLRNGEPTGFAPFRALTPSPANRAFLSRMVRALVERPDAPLTAPEARAIDEGVAALEALPPARRSIAALHVHLFGERYARAGIGVQRDPQECRQIVDHAERVGPVLAFDECGQRIERVEQEVRIDLLMERVEARIQRIAAQALDMDGRLPQIVGIQHGDDAHAPAEECR